MALGFEKAKYECMLCMDADLQHEPEAVPKSRHRFWTETQNSLSVHEMSTVENRYGMGLDRKHFEQQCNYACIPSIKVN